MSLQLPQSDQRHGFFTAYVVSQVYLHVLADLSNYWKSLRFSHDGTGNYGKKLVSKFQCLLTEPRPSLLFPDPPRLTFFPLSLLSPLLAANRNMKYFLINIMILKFRRDRSGQTVQIQIRLLL